MLAYSFSFTQQKICYLMTICGLWGFYILRRLILSICKHASSTAEFSFLYSPIGKNSWFNVPEHIFLYDDGFNAGYFHIEVDEAKKPIFLLFNDFDRTGICQFIFNPIQVGRMGKVQKGLLLVSLDTFLFLFLILLRNCCKMSGPYLMKVPNYWPWFKTTPQNQFSRQIRI